MKIWIDDTRPAPDGYVWCVTTNEAKLLIQNMHAIIQHNNWEEVY